MLLDGELSVNLAANVCVITIAGPEFPEPPPGCFAVEVEADAEPLPAVMIAVVYDIVFLVLAANCAATRFSAAATSRGAVPRVTAGAYVVEGLETVGRRVAKVDTVEVLAVFVVWLTIAWLKFGVLVFFFAASCKKKN